MSKITSCIRIIRPGNAIMTAVAVILGFWVARSDLPIIMLLPLCLSALCAVGFGNIVNDIHDIESDRVNHPDRPLPSGALTRAGAVILAAALAAFALASAWYVSILHLAACAVPLVLLWLYAERLKATALVGNILVSFLVAYAILYGGIGARHFSHLAMPAFLAFLLNVAREIVKDIQDRPGDSLHGVVTTATLPIPVLRLLLGWLGVLYLLNLFMPFIFGHFGWVYCAVCAAIVLPVHIVWMIKVFTRLSDMGAVSAISALIKWEMLAGLAAVALDRWYFVCVR